MLIGLSLTSTREALPDDAKFVVDLNQKIVVPAPVPGRFIFHEVPEHDSDTWDRIVTCAELLDENGPYRDFRFPNTPEWNRFELDGPEVSLFRVWIAKPESRWDDSGYWRY